MTKGYYRHKKGNLYRVLYEAKDSETCEALIVYQAMYGKGDVWVRPKEMFFEEGRFQYVEESEALKLIPTGFTHIKDNATRGVAQLIEEIKKL